MTERRSGYPFDRTGVVRGADGRLGYTGLAPSLGHAVRATVRARPRDEAVAEVGGERLTYEQLWLRATAVAGGLRAAGVGRGDRVAIRLPNGAAWVLAFLGTVLAGGVAVPVNTRFTEPEVEHVLADSGARLVLDSVDLPTGRPVLDEGVRGDDLAQLFYTSGTTGRPKGAMLTHANVLANAESVRRVRWPERETAAQRNLISVPLFHVTGCNGQLVPMLVGGGRAVLLPQFTVQAFLAALAAERITVSTSVPAIYWLALNQPDFASRDLSSLAVLTYGGAPIAPELVARLRRALPHVRLGNGYGQSEATNLATFLPHEWAQQRPETVGFPAPCLEARLHPEPGPDDDPVGELLLRGQTVGAGYWGDPVRTAETFVDGWLHTGDIVRIDRDGPDAGIVTLLDRAKDMVCRGGENVYSAEVEAALAEHPAVGEVAIIGLPDEVMGERVGAVLVPAGPGLDVAAVLADLRGRLADFKVPEWVAVRAEPLPRNAGGKVLKTTLRGELDWQRVARPARG